MITGAASGLGAAMADILIAAGWQVLAVDRHAPEPRDALIHVRADLAVRAEVEAAMVALEAAGPFDLAIFNAGLNATGRFEAMPLDAYRNLLVLNAETPMVMASRMMRNAMVTHHLCFVSSLSHFTGYPGAAVYAASKDALAVYAASVRRPFGDRGVSVTLACPGPLRTGHAARHAPPGADARKRADPHQTARRIIAATMKGRALVVPGRAAALAALAGRLAPGFVTRGMKRVIFDRLDREIW